MSGTGQKAEAQVAKEAHEKEHAKLSQMPETEEEEKPEELSQMPETAEEEEAVDKSQELDEVNDGPYEVLCGYCGEYWPFPDSKCVCGFTCSTSKCKIKCDGTDSLTKPWLIIGDEVHLDNIDNIDEGNEAFEEPDEEGWPLDEEANISSMEEGRNMSPKKDSNVLSKAACKTKRNKRKTHLPAPAVAEIHVDPADLNLDDIEAAFRTKPLLVLSCLVVQFLGRLIDENSENPYALKLADAILAAMNLINEKTIGRNPLVIEPGREIPTSSTSGNATYMPFGFPLETISCTELAGVSSRGETVRPLPKTILRKRKAENALAKNAQKMICL